MKNNLLSAKLCAWVFLMALLMTSCHSTQKITNTTTRGTITINEKGQAHLLGHNQRADLQQAPFEEWYQANYDAYIPDESKLQKCKGKTKNVRVKAFMATWCGDSKREVPRFYKTMDALGFAENQIQLVNVARKSPAYKQSPTHEERGLNIHRVPTFIFYKDGKEIGRIVESPVTSLETDIAQILTGLPSTPNYQVVSTLNILFEEKGVDYVEENMETLAKQVRRKLRSASELNTYGYVLKDTNQAAARCIFQMNAALFPKVANTHDSLGEFYAELGEKEKALACYEKVLALTPEDERVQELVQELKL